MRLIRIQYPSGHVGPCRERSLSPVRVGFGANTGLAAKPRRFL